MKDVRARISAVVLAATLGATAVGTVGSTAQALSTPPIPTLTLDHTISSQPWTGSRLNAGDLEGSAYVPSDNSLWVTDDNNDRVYEINPTNGLYKSSFAATAFQAAAQFGTGINGIPAVLSDPSRTDDFESAAYDPTGDVLYIFSGNCCSAGLPPGTPMNPTAYKLTRPIPFSGAFHIDSWQPLATGQDPTASGWRPGSGLYFGHGTKIKTYDYASNSIGPDINVNVPAPIVGMTFTDAGSMFVSLSDVAGSIAALHPYVVRINPATSGTWQPTPGWTFDLTANGVKDPRSVEIIPGTGTTPDKFYVLDGYDFRPAGDPLAHAIFVFTLGTAPPPTASFTAAPTRGRVPYTVQFTDTSTPLAPAAATATTWLWDFGDPASGAVNNQSALQNPTHTYTTVGTFTARLVASNASGGSTNPATQQIVVNPATSFPGGYSLDAFGALHPFRVGTGPPPPGFSGTPYWVGWDIARGVSTLASGTGGYEVDGVGGLHPFGIGGNPAPPAAALNRPYWPGWDIVRGVALLPNGTGGYLLDAFGAVHPFGIGTNAPPRPARNTPWWFGHDVARGIVLTKDGSGGYIVDFLGAIHPFNFDDGSRDGTRMPPAPNSVYTTPWGTLHGIALISDGTGGLTIDAFGGLHGFGVGLNAPPPASSGAASWGSWNIARGISLLPDV